MNLDDLLSRLDVAEEERDGWIARCPAHADTHASLRVTISDAGKVLVKCRAGCETPNVVASLGLTMRDLATMEPGDARPTATATSTDRPASPADVAALAVRLDGWAEALSSARLSHDETVCAAFDYAETRFGLDGDACERLGLGYADDLGGGPRLVVPFRDRDGVARGFQARALDPKAAVRWLGPPSPEGASWAKIGWFPGSSGWDEVVIAEGPGDALTASAAGYDTIGIRGAGLASNPAVVADVVEWLGDREAVIAGDGDPAGRRFAATLAEAIVDAGGRARVLDVPDGEDLTSWREADPSVFLREFIRAVTTSTPVTSRDAALLAWDEGRYALSDLGGARYLRDYIVSLGSGVRWTPEAGFLLLVGGVWRIDDRQQVRTYAQAVADRVKQLSDAAAEVAQQNGATQQERSRARRFIAYARHAQTSRGIDAMLRELQAVDGVPASINDFDQHPDLLAVRNGVVDLRTGELLPHDPDLLLSRRIDLDYDPEATAPRWEQFLAEVFPGSPGMPDYLRSLVGYGITGHTDEQIFVIHHGKGANGKSLFTDTLTEVFREITTTTPFSTFEAKPSGGIPNDLAALKGARLVMASEGEQGKRMAEAVLKRVTGRDLIAARFMRQEFFEFRPTFLLMLATNAEPNFRGQDEGLWRRVKLLKWERFFAPHERDKRLGAKLLAEKAGILAWAVRGAREWYAHGLVDPENVTVATEEYRATSNVLDGFLPGVYEFTDDGAGTVRGDVLFHDFQTWAEEENLAELRAWSRKAFYGALVERGLRKRVGGARKTVFDGVRRARPTAETGPAPAAPAATPEPAPAAPVVPPISGANLTDYL